MQCTGENLSKYVSEGRVFHIVHSENVSHRKKLLYEFLQIQRESPPQEVHQLEALGGTLHSMLSIIYPTYYVGFEVEEMRFIIRICTEHMDIPYLVVCVLQIIYRYIGCVSIPNIIPILPDIYTFLIGLTTYHHEKNIQKLNPYWSIDITKTWGLLFIIHPSTCSTFFDNSETVYAFLEILRCKPRDVIISSSHVSTSGFLSNTIFVSEGLRTIRRDYYGELCFDFIYLYLFNRNMDYVINGIAEYWPFILAEDRKLISLTIILKIINQINQEEDYPKSANKR
jgi:hypothetical protein